MSSNNDQKSRKESFELVDELHDKIINFQDETKKLLIKIKNKSRK